MLTHEDILVLAERFPSRWRLAENGCWQWTSTVRKPYKKYSYANGEIVRHKVKYHAHRVSWLIHRGEIPNDMHVLHKCDNPLCVNPEHLYLGTHRNNMRDMSIRNRAHWRKITNEQALEIRASNETLKVLATKYGVHPSSIWYIRKRRSKHHLTPTPQITSEQSST
jgi:hypothetical protein